MSRERFLVEVECIGPDGIRLRELRRWMASNIRDALRKSAAGGGDEPIAFVGLYRIDVTPLLRPKRKRKRAVFVE